MIKETEHLQRNLFILCPAKDQATILTMVKSLFIILGSLSLLLGVIGIILPGLPTTPFVLLSAYLYMRSSEKLYNKLIANRHIGPYIINYRKNKGVSRSAKIKAVILQWVMISISCIWGIENDYIRIIVIAAGLIGTYVLLRIVPTAASKS